MPTYTIKKGNHYACPPTVAPLFFIKRINISWRFRLSASCWYPLGAINAHGVNKIVGLAFGTNHHQNSIRLGFQPDFNKDGWFTIYAYWYHHGKRFYMPFANIPANKDHTFTIFERADGIFRLVLSNETQSCEHFVSTTKSKIGYSLKPYFGGQSKAPWDMQIEVTKI